MQSALWVSVGVLAGLAAWRIWIGYRLGELRHDRRRTRTH
ncbi:hypothetical protein FB475_5106 [Kribbella jejuensis]|uniref:Uncharacterized protein n=1 Tax=Kribbella jejuensis TaxID=236068 RepID=A0A542EA88_9ACTN|nr:hypothetical protein FB475_5106 [Kribbella jejuensis]